MKINKTKIILIFALTILVVTGSLYTYLYFSFEGMKSSVIELRDKYAQNKATVLGLFDAEQNINTTLNISDKLLSLFVKQDSIVDFIQLIESLMKSNRLNGGVDSVLEQTSPELDALGKETLVVKLTAKGDWNGILKFVALLEKLPYKSTLDSVSFGTVSDVSAGGASDKDKKITKDVWQVSAVLNVIVIKSDANKVDVDKKPVPPNVDNLE